MANISIAIGITFKGTRYSYAITIEHGQLVLRLMNQREDAERRVCSSRIQHRDGGCISVTCQIQVYGTAHTRQTVTRVQPLLTMRLSNNR
jgi:hypothetical protein